ncbi:hypothetical protein LguiA_015157 [Lonicera macranthoides]
MENPIPQILSPSNSVRRRKSTVSNSPEFEFWIPRNNPSFPPPELLPADQLILDGILLPLHFLPLNDPLPSNPQPSYPNPDPHPDPEPASGPDLSATDSTLTASKRWRDIFKKSDNRKNLTANSTEVKNVDKDKSKKKDRKINSGGPGFAELNINIWPFARSRSAGTGGIRPRMVAATRKVSSAPCSRSNSAGESKSRRWPSSPSRGGGVHLGRSSPVWQVRRGGSAIRNGEKKVKNEGMESRRSKIAGGGGGREGKGKVVNVDVPVCIGYRQHLSCRSDVNGAVSGCGRSGGVDAGDSGRGGNLFNLRSLFTKKMH